MNGKAVARSYGVFVLGAGLWPVFHLRSFEAVTGPKADGWLVKTVGVLLAAIGGTLVAGSRRAEVPRELAGLGLATALGLGGIDVYYALRGRISKVYLLDAIVEAGAAACFARMAGSRTKVIPNLEQARRRFRKRS